MNFEQAVKLAEAINRHACWSAEIEADDTYMTVSARYERFGLVYNAEIESVIQWGEHLQRISEWEESRA